MASPGASNIATSGGDVLLSWVIHALADDLVKLDVGQVLQLLIHVDVFGLCAADDLAGDTDRDFSDAVEGWVQPADGVLLLSERLGETLGGGIDHLLGNVHSLAEKSAETDTWEDVHIVTLTWVVGGTVLAEVVWEGGARGEDDLLIGPFHGLVESAFSLVDWIRQWEDDWARGDSSHLFDDRLSEDTAGSAKTHKSSGLDIIDNLLEAGELLTLIVIAREVELVVGKLVATVVGDEALRIDEPELLAGLFLWNTRLDEKLDDLTSDTDSGGTSTHENELVLVQRNARLLESVHDTCQDDSTGSLDIIVEASVGVAVSLERWEGVLKILELDNDSWPFVVQGNHHLIQELQHLRWADTVHLSAQVKWVVEVVLIVGTQVEGDWKGTLWMDTSASAVEGELSNWDTHSVHTQISETEDTRSIGDDGDVDLILTPIIKHLTQLTAIGPGKVETCNNS